jgi:hypothetical protein
MITPKAAGATIKSVFSQSSGEHHKQLSVYYLERLHHDHEREQIDNERPAAHG